MTLLIDSQLEGHEDGNEFRSKLRKWLNTGHSLQQLPGINLMWEELAHWLERRINEGRPFRRLILPTIPKNWRHIGYTRRLTFPNKTDLRLMEGFLADCPQAQTDPNLVIRKFPVVLLNDRASDALKLAFREFREAYLLGRRTLADLPFWRLLRRALAHSGKSARRSVVVDMMFDADGSRSYFSCPEQALQAEFHPTLFMALSGVSAQVSLNLGAAIQSGFLFFRQVGVGRWRAEARPCNAPQGLHVALARRHAQRLGNRLGSLVSESEWLLTSAAHSYHAVYETLGPMGLISQPSEQIVRPLLSSGVRVPHGWLGRPGFLPFIESDAVDYLIRPADASEEEAPITMEGGQLVALSPVEGSFVIEPVRELGEKSAPWRLRVQLFQDALPHPDLGSSARYRLELLSDWSRVSPALVIFDEQDVLEWETGPVDCEHLLEVIYASGVSGWEEAELVTLLHRLNASSWTLLRCFQDAGIIEPRQRSGWKGRAWTLAEPRLVRIARPGHEDLVVIEGAVCARLVEDFQTAVIGLGGKCFRRLGVSPWSPPVIGASVASLEALAKIMGWPLVLNPLMPDAVPLAFAGTERMPDLHEVASTWDWSTGCFKDIATREETVTLTRRVHPGGRDHDLYCLTSRRGTTNWLSRTAAITAAHALTRTSLFEQRDGQLLVRLARDGGLPDALAAGLRRRLLRTGGPMGAEYVYPVTPDILKWLGSLLPGCLAELALPDEQSPGRLVAEARRSRGQQRLHWCNGQLTLPRHT